MTITVEHNDGKIETFQHVSDAYLCVRQETPVMDSKQSVAVLPETRSLSWGANVRELVKELRQSLVELQDFMRADGNRS